MAIIYDATYSPSSGELIYNFEPADIRRQSVAKAVFEASIAHDKARQLPACRPERVEEVLWDWALNHDEMDIQKVQAELKYLYHEQEAEAQRQQGISGNA